MKILISGSTGLVGSELSQVLIAKGYDVVRLVRQKKLISADSIFWDPDHGVLDANEIRGVDVVINLSGENVAARRWSEAQKKKILDSRINATRTIVKAITSLPQPPKVLINASAVGYYGDRGLEICSETTSKGSGFLADVCVQWEKAAAPAAKKGIRTVFLRTGVVLSPNGGALAKMLPPFKLGLGGNLGSGKQYMSWVAIEDVVLAIIFIMEHPQMEGPVNIVAPNPVTNGELTKSLGKVLYRPTVLPAPAFVLRLLLGKEMANDFLLSSTRASPVQLLNAGYRFKYPELEQALKHSIE